MSSVIEIDQLSFAYDKAVVLDIARLHVKEKELIAIFGPNGGGKTTLLKLIMGFLKPSKGVIRVFGCLPKESRTHIAYVPQSARFDRDFPITVLEVVLQGALHQLSGWGFFAKNTIEKARSYLAKVSVAHLETAPFGSLSGGQAQKVLIARALMSEPKILLLDEPTASIDSESEATIYQILHELRLSTTILMVTHDLQPVLSRVDRLLCVQKQVTSISSAEVCQHFAMGLYHHPVSVRRNNP